MTRNATLCSIAALLMFAALALLSLLVAQDGNSTALLAGGLICLAGSLFVWGCYTRANASQSPALRSPSRRTQVILAAAPLAMSALLWMGVAARFETHMRWRDLSERLFGCTALSALGPFSPMFVLGGRTAFHAMPWVALLLWSAYLLLVAKTRLGDAHWALLLVGGSLWCLFGLTLGSIAGLGVT